MAIKATPVLNIVAAVLGTAFCIYLVSWPLPHQISQHDWQRVIYTIAFFVLFVVLTIWNVRTARSTSDREISR
jgi:predicted membrane channel-forming protein YqfA (hemolysin III family)